MYELHIAIEIAKDCLEKVTIIITCILSQYDI